MVNDIDLGPMISFASHKSLLEEKPRNGCQKECGGGGKRNTRAVYASIQKEIRSRKAATAG